MVKGRDIAAGLLALGVGLWHLWKNYQVTKKLTAAMKAPAVNVVAPSNPKVMGLLVMLACALVMGRGLTACATVAKSVTSVAASLAGPVSGQATTLAQAIQLADLATKATKVTVDSVKLPKATLIQLSALNDGVHSALVDLETANTMGQSLSFASFNAALDAYNSYAVAVGVGKIN